MYEERNSGFFSSIFLCEKTFGTMREKPVHVGSKIYGERKTFKPLNDPSHRILGRFGYGYRNMYLPSCCFGALLGAPILRAEQFRYYWKLSEYMECMVIFVGFLLSKWNRRLIVFIPLLITNTSLKERETRETPFRSLLVRYEHTTQNSESQELILCFLLTLLS